MEVREPPATYAEYCQLPEGAPRYEILRGVGMLTPSPGTRHQTVCSNLGWRLYQYVKEYAAGRVFFAPYDVILSEKNVVQPDILFLSREKSHLVKERGLFGAPDLVVEVISPGSARRDLQQKLSLYAEYGVAEYWAVDSANRTVDLWSSRKAPLDERRIITGEGSLQSEVLPGFTVDLPEIFAGIDAISME